MILRVNAEAGHSDRKFIQGVVGYAEVIVRPSTFPDVDSRCAIGITRAAACGLDICSISGGRGVARFVETSAKRIAVSVRPIFRTECRRCVVNPSVVEVSVRD